MISSCPIVLLTLLVTLSTAGPCAGAGAWTPLGPFAGSVRALAQAPTRGMLDAGTYAGGVFRSSDAGAPPHPDVIALAVDRTAPGRLMVGTGGGSVWRLDTADR